MIVQVKVVGCEMSINLRLYGVGCQALLKFYLFRWTSDVGRPVNCHTQSSIFTSLQCVCVCVPPAANVIAMPALCHSEARPAGALCSLSHSVSFCLSTLAICRFSVEWLMFVDESTQYWLTESLCRLLSVLSVGVFATGRRHVFVYLWVCYHGNSKLHALISPNWVYRWR